MLQAYRVSTYITVDGKRQCQSFNTQTILVEDFGIKTTEEVYTFQTIIDNKAAGLNYITVGKNWLFQRPYVKICYNWCHEELYYKFDTLTVETHYEPCNLTMNELFGGFSADKCIQYLKERGMNTCPILK